MKKYFIITFGCQMNRSDSERIANLLENDGFQQAPKIDEADLIVVNMCSVRQSAVDRVYGLAPKFKKLKTENSKLKTILTGCVLKSNLEKFKKYFDFVLSIKALSYFPEILKKTTTHPPPSQPKAGPLYFYYPYPRDKKFNEKLDAYYLKEKPKNFNNFSAFVPIMTGCNNFCTFCVVPYVRGPEIYRPAEEILCEVKDLIKRGFKEIWLLGQNVNSYRSKSKIKNNKSKIINFAKLLKMVDDIPGNFWIRFTSPHPKDFSDELIRVMAKCQKITPYLNLPAQSGDDEILKKMNRPYTVGHYKKLIKKIRREIPEISLSTDVIVGFPGETKEQFENTVKLFKEIKYDMAYIAKYSPRPGTTAVKLKDDVSPEEKERRYKILTEILRQAALEKNKKYVGKKVEVLVEKQKKEFLVGKTRTYKTIKIESQTTNYKLQTTNLVGQFVKVKIIDALSLGLKGVLIS